MDLWARGCLVTWAAGPGEKAKGTSERLEREMERVAAGLAGPTPSPVEAMLCDTAALCWFGLRLHEVRYAAAADSERGLTAQQHDSHQRRLDRSHRRLMLTLAAVRRLAAPT